MGELWDLLRAIVAGALEGMWEFVTVALLTILLLGLGAVWNLVTRPKKQEELRRIAATLGMSFDSMMDLSGRAFFQFPLFQKGRELSTEDVLHGTTGGHEVLFFTYEYQIGEGEGTRWPTSQTVAAFRVEGRRLPHFRMKPQPFSSLFRPRGMNFDSHKRFSNGCLLQGDDERAIRSMFDAPLLELFSRESGWCVEGGDEWLVIYKHGHRVARKSLPDHMTRMSEIARLFPNSDGQASHSEPGDAIN